MRARRADRQAAPRGDLADLAAQRRAAARPASAVFGARLGRDLEHRLHQLGLDLARVGCGVLEQRLDRVDEVEDLGVDDHQLLLDADRVARPGEVVLHRRRPERYRRLMDPQSEPMTPSEDLTVATDVLTRIAPRGAARRRGRRAAEARARPSTRPTCTCPARTSSTASSSTPTAPRPCCATCSGCFDHGRLAGTGYVLDPAGRPGHRALGRRELRAQPASTSTPRTSSSSRSRAAATRSPRRSACSARSAASTRTRSRSSSSSTTTSC